MDKNDIRKIIKGGKIRNKYYFLTQLYSADFFFNNKPYVIFVTILQDLKLTEKDLKYNSFYKFHKKYKDEIKSKGLIKLQEENSTISYTKSSRSSDSDRKVPERIKLNISSPNMTVPKPTITFYKPKRKLEEENDKM